MSKMSTRENFSPIWTYHCISSSNMWGGASNIHIKRNMFDCGLNVWSGIFTFEKSNIAWSQVQFTFVFSHLISLCDYVKWLKSLICRIIILICLLLLVCSFQHWQDNKNSVNPGTGWNNCGWSTYFSRHKIQI